MNGRAWTKDDDAIISATIQRPAVEVAVELGRTRDAVNKRRSRLVAAGDLAKRDRRTRPDSVTWTAAEDAIVIETVGLPVREAAERIPGHTLNAVRLRRRGLRKRGLISASDPHHPNP